MGLPERQIVSKAVHAHPNNYDPGRGEQKVRGFVIHTMDGSLAGTESWFSQPEARVSAHYGVGLDGRVTQFVSEADTAFHAGRVVRPRNALVQWYKGNPNEYTIGIETEDGRNPGGVERTEEQIAAVTELVYRGCVGYGIKPSSATIMPHSAVYALKSCPGNFPVGEVIKRVAARFRAEGRMK